MSLTSARPWIGGCWQPLRAERGQSLVELAMVLPLLSVLVFGIVEFGRAFQTWIAITNAAREGARLGATADMRLE